ncbi:phosphate-starvation-inducible PsiE family protein [Cereibacter sphaeroides]|uniref:phosphate-starvation-inducible protein PsiE n=1 Tax=Rhodobacterales TaxID=204455 RepID=UPI000BBE4D34|nr:MULTISPECIES: phosphate-starvation-inducible PsiE family protein [Paracoccaceae]MCE6952141.1 phosphate-starvation-inducible PsiE family protein [Cereibacter sphaeroides]
MPLPEEVAQDPAPGAGKAEEALLVAALGAIERGLLVMVALLTLAATAIEIWSIAMRWSVNLGDILLMFLYTEVIAMVAVFYTGKGLPFVYPIFIAITALARLIVLQGKDMDPQNIVLEASAILLLSVAAVVLLRLARR